MEGVEPEERGRGGSRLVVWVGSNGERRSVGARPGLGADPTPIHFDSDSWARKDGSDPRLPTGPEFGIGKLEYDADIAAASDADTDVLESSDPLRPMLALAQVLPLVLAPSDSTDPWGTSAAAPNLGPVSKRTPVKPRGWGGRQIRLLELVVRGWRSRYFLSPTAWPGREPGIRNGRAYSCLGWGDMRGQGGLAVAQTRGVHELVRGRFL